MADNKANLRQEVTIDGIKYLLEGNVDFSNMTIKKLGDTPIPDPEPGPVDPTKPTEGTIKPGGWGADLVNKDAWKVVPMRDSPEQFKVVDGAGKNVATNFTKKETAEGFIAYFKTHEFPPKDTEPVPEPGPTPEPTPGGKGQDQNGVQLLCL